MANSSRFSRVNFLVLLLLLHSIIKSFPASPSYFICFSVRTTISASPSAASRRPSLANFEAQVSC
ncbi:hypothetical protein E2C01_097073 [Portunus trituberculatus]|uniref:Secreted protein n=1 Tax=Portunus trituberculatus TaxID=210409 RepID=A0A5B7JXC6_PORTR|nr:hypothetical protein [Portunus trituberculatus]